MTTRRSVWVECDICGLPSGGHGSDWTEFADEARTVTKARGWHRTRRGDICPDCWSEGKR